MKEIWKDIRGFKNKYQISNLGKIKSLGRFIKHPRYGKYYRKERILKPKLTRGYFIAFLYDNKVYKEIKVRRLVGEHFVKGYKKGLCINHINGIKEDNRAINLEWCTISENLSHAHRIGLCDKRGENHHGAKLNNPTVIKIRKLYDGGMTQAELFKKFKLSRERISLIVRRKAWKHI